MHTLCDQNVEQNDETVGIWVAVSGFSREEFQKNFRSNHRKKLVLKCTNVHNFVHVLVVFDLISNANSCQVCQNNLKALAILNK